MKTAFEIQVIKQYQEYCAKLRLKQEQLEEIDALLCDVSRNHPDLRCIDYTSKIPISVEIKEILSNAGYQVDNTEEDVREDLGFHIRITW